MINYEKIKRMSVEELANQLANVFKLIESKYFNDLYCVELPPFETYKKWLESEVNNELL